MNTVARVKELISERNLSLHKLSILSGVAYSTLKNTEWRNGQLGVDTIEKICCALGISMADFFSDEADCHEN